MYIAYTPRQEAFAAQMREYFEDIVTPQVADDMAHGLFGSPACLEAVRQMGKDNWLAVSWPEQVGGRNLSLIDQHIFLQEAHRANAPVPFLTINSVGQTILEYGTANQRQRFLPGIRKGLEHWAIGYTEPEAGTDLASLQTKATQDGDEWVINGQKIFTSLAGYADYIWLAARTDPEAPKHAGISIFIVPTNAPGFSFTPIRTLGSADTTSTFYEDVRVSAENVIGDVNGGWRLITNQLNYERLSLAVPAWGERAFDRIVEWAKNENLPDGRRVIDQEWVQISLARCKAELEYLKLLNWKAAGQETIEPALASSAKVFATEMYPRIYRSMMEILGQGAYVPRGSNEAILQGALEHSCQGTLILTFGGGTNEIQRDLIAMFGLGMPRTPRM